MVKERISFSRASRSSSRVWEMEGEEERGREGEKMRQRLGGQASSLHHLVVPNEAGGGVVLVELVVEERPVGLTLDLLPSLPQSDWSLSSVLLWLGTETSSPVDQSLFQFVDTSLGQGLGYRAPHHTHTQLGHTQSHTPSLSHSTCTALRLSLMCMRSVSSGTLS